MDKAKSITKSGWHPKGKDGGRESWRGDFKGINQVAGWVGKGKSSPSVQTAPEHTARPRATLKDPAAFGPPPKNVNYHGGAALPGTVTPDRRGLGAPLALDTTKANDEQKRGQEEAGTQPAPPPVPYRIDRTGINTGALPKPPRRTVELDPGVDGGELITESKPRLPPRLPPRHSNTDPGEKAPSPPPTYTAATQGFQDGSFKQGAADRIGLRASPKQQEQQQESNPWREQSSSSTTTPFSGFGDLKSRFPAPLTRNSAASSIMAQSPTSPPPEQGTTWQEKQAALKTASALRNDPSSISMAEAKATASTANNFRERHGEQVAQGWRAGNGLNKKYGIIDKANGYGGTAHRADIGATPSMGTESAPAHPGGGSGVGLFGQAVGALDGFKKPPPPPPTRRITGGTAAPPPVPLNSKPR
ncbi:MAG: hypothetical protein Q9163_000164 [Psora crenata]